MTNKVLYGRATNNNLTLFEAITKCTDVFKHDGIGLLYSPKTCQLIKFDANNSNLINSKGEKINIEYTSNYIFEARIFNEDYELRWLNELGGKGKAVLISEETISNIFSEDVSLNFLDKISQTYVLWGEAAKSSTVESWQKIAKSRVGALDIPLSQSRNSGRNKTPTKQSICRRIKNWIRTLLKRKSTLSQIQPISKKKTIDKTKRVYLSTIEYLAEVDNFGNVTVVEERLIKLEVK